MSQQSAPQGTWHGFLDRLKNPSSADISGGLLETTKSLIEQSAKSLAPLATSQYGTAFGWAKFADTSASEAQLANQAANDTTNPWLAKALANQANAA